MATITKCVTVDVDVDIDLDDEEVIEELQDDDLIEEVERRGYKVLDESTAARHLHLASLAESALRSFKPLPRDVQDFFWEVHGVALHDCR